MKSRKTDFTLDNTAQELYQQLAGIDTTRRILTPQAGSELIALLGQEEKILDHFRLVLLNSVCLLAEILNKCRLSSLEDHTPDKKIELFKTIKELAGLQNFDGKITINYRGNSQPDQLTGSDTYDYEVGGGTLLLDLEGASNLEKRFGRQQIGSSMHNRLLTAFKTFSALQIHNLHIDRINKDTDTEEHATALTALCRYYQKLAGKDKSDFIILDEYDLPNANLSMLAMFNRVGPAAIQKLVAQIRPMLFGPAPQKELATYCTVFNAIFAFPKLRDQLKKPPLEVNNIQRLVPGRMNTAQAQISRFAIANYGSAPHKVAEAISSVNVQGYKNIYTGTLQKRLSLASDFLKIMQGQAGTEPAEREALLNIEAGLEMVHEEAYDDIEFSETDVTSVNERGESIAWTPHKEIFNLLNFFKKRNVVKKKIRDMIHQQINFDQQDYTTIARNFQITESQAEHLILLLKSCFDTKGCFRRVAFEKNIPGFIQYEEKVFEFLWHYLKELIARDDRVAFLNALQHLIAQLRHPQKAFTILLRDIFCRSHKISFSDRNGLLLTNILLRRYNQELGSHIELTPEEVLQVKDGLNSDMVEQAQTFLADEQYSLFIKIRTIHEELQKSILPPHGQQGMPLRYLTTLERELIIFLALTGGPIAHRVLRSITGEYGNPFSNVYQTLKSPVEIKSFLQLLQVAARGLRRFSDVEDLAVFQAIYNREHDFLALWDHEPHAKLVRRVLEWMR